MCGSGYTISLGLIGYMEYFLIPLFCVFFGGAGDFVIMSYISEIDMDAYDVCRSLQS